MREPLGSATARMQSHGDFWLTKACVLARSEAHVAGEDELTACAPDAAADSRDADHRRCGETDERIQEYWKAGKTDSRHDIAQVAGQVKVCKKKIRNRAFEYDDAKVWARIHSREQVLKAMEHRAIHNVERSVIENDPPISGRLLDDPQW